MGRLIVDEWMSLDGVVQAPGGRQEDTSGGFEHGGWHLQYFDPESQQWVVDYLNDAGGFLFGRRTYRALSSYWPNASEEEQPVAEPLNSKPKYVVSSTLEEPLDWNNSSLLDGDVVESVQDLKEQDGGDIHLIGSSQLGSILIRSGVVDGFNLMIDPITLGGGKRVFVDDGALRRFRLVDSQTTSTGAILATYERLGDG